MQLFTRRAQRGGQQRFPSMLPSGSSCRNAPRNGNVRSVVLQDLARYQHPHRRAMSSGMKDSDCPVIASITMVSAAVGVMANASGKQRFVKF